MKIYIGHSNDFDFKKELYVPLRGSSINADHELILPHEKSENAEDFITRDIIPTCDLVIGEVSYPSLGLGIELGWADKASCPIVCIHKTGIKISSAISIITKEIREYGNTLQMIEIISTSLER